MFAFLAEHRGALFPAEMFADMYGRRYLDGIVDRFWTLLHDR